MLNEQEYFFGMRMAKLFSEGPTSTLDGFNFLVLPNNPYCLILRKGPVDQKHQIRLLGKTLIIDRQFD